MSVAADPELPQRLYKGGSLQFRTEPACKSSCYNCVDALNLMRTRIIASAAVGILSGAFCWFLMKHLHQGAADFGWAIHLAQRVVARQNPYDTPFEQYPLPAALFGLPFLPFAPELAAGLFWGISSSLLAFGLTRQGYTRLLVFLAYPYWAGILTVQWSPIIAASAFFPSLFAVTMAKPQVGFPVFVTHLTRRGVLMCVIVACATIVIKPNWPLLWLRQTANYQHFIPLLVLPGPLLLLALLRYRERSTWLLLASALMPQRWFFDSFTLWLIPRSRREILWTAFLSWGAGVWRWYHVPQTFVDVGRCTVVSIYLPMMVLLMLRRTRRGQQQSSREQARTDSGEST